MSYNVRSTHYYLVFLLLRTTRQMYVIELFRISILTNNLHKLFSTTRLHLEFSFFSSLSYCTFRENSSHLLHTTSIQRVWPKKNWVTLSQNSLLPEYMNIFIKFSSVTRAGPLDICFFFTPSWKVSRIIAY